MARRYALREDQWERIRELLPGREGHVGARREITGCLWKRSYTGIARGFPGGIYRPGLGIFA